MVAQADSEPARSGTSRLVVGVVGRPHGLDGSFHVSRPRAVPLREGAIVVLGRVPHSVVRSAGTPQRPILRLDGCTDRAGAEALKGMSIEVAPEALPALGENEWWAEELEGCSVSDGAGAVGVVRRMLELPSCEVLEVSRDDGSVLLVPMVGDAVRSVDVEAGRIDIDLAFLGEPGIGQGRGQAPD